MKTSVFEYDSYKKYLSDWADSQANGGRGVRSKYAEASGTKTAYISQVLSGSAHFSLEQAEGLSQFLLLGKTEKSYFLLLVQYARAGTPALRAHFSELIEIEKQKRLSLKNRVVAKSLPLGDQERYFGDWIYSAIHMALSIQRLQTRASISRYLGVPQKKVSFALDYLVGVGIAKKEPGDRYSVGNTRLHLAHDSPMVTKHHTNWRLQAIRNFDNVRPEDQHYSSVISIHRSDAVRIKKKILELIDETNQIISDAREEDIYSFSIDLFLVGQE